MIVREEVATTDGFGLDDGFAGTVAPALDLLHDGWRRLRITGADRVPAEGPAVIAVGLEAPSALDVVAAAVAVQRAVGRTPRVVAPEDLFALPFAGVALRRLGAVPPARADAVGLLRRGELVLVRVTDRHDATCAELALAARVPVVACAVSVLPYVPLPGPLGGLPVVPKRVRVAFGQPVPPPEDRDPGDRAAVLDLADAVRVKLALGVRRNLT